MSLNLLENHLLRIQEKLDSKLAGNNPGGVLKRKIKRKAKASKSYIEQAQLEVAGKKKRLEDTVKVMAEAPKVKSKTQLRNILRACSKK